MSSIRPLDRVAIAAFIIALGATSAGFLIPGRPAPPFQHLSPSQLGDQLLAEVRSPEMRADLALLTELRASAPDPATLSTSGVRSDSARIALHKGIVWHGQARIAALWRASEADPSNALPLYLLAVESSSHGDWKQTDRYLDQAGRRTSIRDYPLPYDRMLASADVAGLLFTSDVDLRWGVYDRLRALCKRSISHAKVEQRSGRMSGALARLSRIEQIGDAVTRAEPHGLVYVVLGLQIQTAALSAERNMHRQIGSTERLMEISGQLGLLAGVRQQVRRMWSAARGGSVSSAAFHYCAYFVFVGMELVCNLFVSFTMILCSLRRMKRMQPHGDLHDEVAAQVLPVRRTPRLYAWTLVPAVAISILCLAASSSGQVSSRVVVAPMLAIITGAMALIRCLVSPYRLSMESLMRARGILADDARGMPRADVVEMCRRSLSILGGYVILLVLFAGCVTGWMRMTYGAYPWQQGNVVLSLLREDERLSTRLLSQLAEAQSAGASEANRPAVR